MSRPIHFAFYSIAATESDPDGDEQIACGLDVSERLTTHRAQTTCKNCLRELNRAAPQPQEQS